MSFAIDLRSKLLNAIQFIEDKKQIFVHHPKTDFSRKRNLSITNIFTFLLGMQEKSLAGELLDFDNYLLQSISSSAMIQARCKLKLSAFEHVFHASHVNSYDAPQYQGYCLLAQDGSDINLRKAALNDPAASLLHLNAFYDLLSQSYVAVDFQTKKQTDERQSLCNIVDTFAFPLPTIIIADRGYESYNVFAHIMHAGQKFLIRAKDPNSNGILSGLTLPTTPEFDVTVKLNLTRLQTKAVRTNPDYRPLTKQVKFDYLPLGSKTILPFKLRIVRVAVAENTYETLITNLPEKEFSMAELKDLYHLRWGIETSFRELKYSLGLAYLHSQRIDLIKQEIYIRLTLYNFTAQLVNHTKVPVKRTGKYTYRINFTRACQISRKFFKDGTINVESVLIKHLLPIRPGRKAPRKLRAHYFKSFLYRIA